MFQNKNILQQEEEFLKLNEEIDLKTLDLMNQVDNLKELQSHTEKLYSEWEKLETGSLPEIKDTKRENYDEHQSGFDSSKNTSEDNFTLKDYLIKLKNDVNESVKSFNPEGFLESTTKENEVPKQDKTRKTLKLSQSAKTSVSLLSTTNIGQDSVLPLGLTRQKSYQKLKQQEVENKVLPESVKGMGQDNITRFLTAKVKLLTEQVEIMQKEEKKYLEKIKELQTYKDKSLEEKEKLTQQVNMTKNVLVKYEQYTNGVQTQLQNFQAENGQLKKELENLKKEIRQSAQNNNGTEVRLNRTLEEVEKLKSALRQVKQEEKDSKEFHKRKIEDLANTVKKLDRQRLELLNGFKKQIIVIDNLKKQKGFIDAAKLLKCAEEDFLNFLDCNPQNTFNRRELSKSAKI